MRARLTRCGPVLVIVMLLTAGCRSTRPSGESAARRATLQQQAAHADQMVERKLVFTGTVLRSEVFDGGSRADVRIERIEDKPAAVSLRAGQMVTVLDAEPRAFTPGQTRRFYSEPVTYGERLTVRLLPEPVAAEAGMSPLEQAVRAAEIVVTGKVVEVRPAPRTALSRTGSRVTEHDPDWCDAEIEVESIAKGAPAMIREDDTNRLVVRFARSMDVSFYRMPKFAVGQEGVFMLQPDNLSAQPTASLQGQEIRTLIAPTMQCFQPLEAEPRIRNMINRPP